MNKTKIILILIARESADGMQCAHTCMGLFQDDMLRNIVEEINWITAN
jgi:hypothetical protein